MASSGSVDQRQQGLQQAASVLFALMGIVPALLFAFTLWQLGALRHTLAQVSLVLTLAFMLLGYWLFRSMLAQMSEIVKGVSRAVHTMVRPVGTDVAAETVAPSPTAQDVAGLGSIWELGEMARTMDLLWQREAGALVGRRVQVALANAEDVTGKLLEATDDGLVLEQAGGGTVAITYLRVKGIEPLASV